MEKKRELVDCKWLTPRLPPCLYHIDCQYPMQQALLDVYKIDKHSSTDSVLQGLDDLCVRFIINLPLEELATPERICFQIEEAQWFYEDFVRPLDPDLPSFNLRNFTTIIFQHCPLLKGWSSDEQAQAFQSFLAYKTTVPVRGAIMLNQNMDQVVLVKGWKKGANWSFPRGKINDREEDLTCAIREVYEETGYDLKTSGLVGEDKNIKYIDVHIRGQELKMYVFRGVPMDSHFEPRTRKEISKIQWHSLSDLPTVKMKKQQQQQQHGHGEDLATNANKFYMVAPFLGPLKKWIAQQRKRDRAMQAGQAKTAAHDGLTNVENATLEQEAIDEQISDDRAEQNHLATLLHTLRQSTQARNGSVPEVSSPAVVKQSNPDTLSKSASLLALVRGSAQHSGNQKPRTPFNQIIRVPEVPKSPSHREPSQTQPIRSPAPPFPIQAPPSQSIGFPTVHHLDALGPTADALPQPPKMRSIPPPTQPAQLASRASGSHPQVPQNRQAASPYDRPRDHIQPSMFPSMGPQGPAVPPASRLPLPNLNPQSSALLNLFKSDSSAKPAILNGGTRESLSSPASSEQKALQAPIPFVPPQVSRRSSQKAPQLEKQIPAQQSSLLDILRSTSTSTNPPQGLQAPVAAVELSASPTPGHSREPSKMAQPDLATQYSHAEKPAGQLKEQSQPDRANPPVSATVNGPLNIPQFEMIKSTSHGLPPPDQKSSRDQAATVRILSRPSSSHAIPVNTTRKPATHSNTPQSIPQKGLIMSLVNPARMQQPPTPNLKAHNAPPKPFQPQILRRSGMPPEINEPSPIQPLPSPSQKMSATQKAGQEDEHKKSLLSLFTKSSPAISPASPTPDNTIDLTSLVSPLEKSATPPIPQSGRRPSDVFAPPPIAPATDLFPALQSEPPKQEKKFYAPDRMPPLASRTDTARSGANDAGHSGPSRGKDTLMSSRSSTTTPVQKEFLLGYLADVVKKGR